jgi:Zn-finger nucleic acid-binding protein
MKCPKCERTELDRIQLGEQCVSVDRCPRCAGVWFDRQELEAVLEAAIQDLRIPGGAKQQGRSCPSCRAPLFAFHYPQTYVSIDMCKQCQGLWLDKDELEEIGAVRAHLQSAGKMQKYDDPTGAKGALLRFIDKANEALMW